MGHTYSLTHSHFMYHLTPVLYKIHVNSISVTKYILITLMLKRNEITK